MRRWNRRMAHGVLALLSATALLIGCAHDGGRLPSAPTTPADPTLAQTDMGMVRGLVAADHRRFANIPYAAPPVGPLRWQPPAPAAPWQGVLDGTKYGPRCIQGDDDLEQGRNTSEDCLTLNVWTPPASNDLRPVLVWIHGGGFISGSSGIYESRLLATRGDVVVVTLNYRLGTLGFLAHPALGPAGAVGNYGLADQQAALRWVHDNIAHFGGDPSQVTIAGESAGGMSVCDHLVAPASEGLFRAAIIQSGPCQAQLALPDAERKSVDYARSAGCDDPATAAQCLRSLPPERLRRAVSYFDIGENELSGPVTGTSVLPVDPMTVFAAGGAAKVPVLIGTNRDEFTLFVALQYLRFGRRFADAEYPGLLADTFGADAPAVAAHYPPDRFGGTALAYAAAVTDGVFACVADRMSDELAAKGNDVYAYEFNDRNPPMPEPFRTLPFPIGASHSLELRYLFSMGGASPMDAAQEALSNDMIDYWTHFVRTGRPAAEGQPDWPQLDAEAGVENRLSLRPEGSRLTTDFADVHQCGFWAQIKR